MYVRVDVRDVAGWMINCVENRRNGVHNLTGPEKPWTLRQFLETTRTAIDSAATQTWADADFLRRDMELQSFTHFPLWASLDEDEGFYQVDGTRALKAGLQYRPLDETAREREVKVLKRWRARTSWPSLAGARSALTCLKRRSDPVLLFLSLAN